MNALVAYFLPPIGSMMRMPQRWLAAFGPMLAVGAIAGAFACGNSDQQTVMEQKKPLGAGNPNNANVKLEKAVREKLAADSRLREAKLTVSADVTRNAVTLAGTVPSEELRRRAVELAREAQAGVLVNDRIQIKPGDSRSEPQQLKSPYA